MKAISWKFTTTLNIEFRCVKCNQFYSISKIITSTEPINCFNISCYCGYINKIEEF